MPTNEKIQKIIEILQSSTRTMPAHFTSNDEAGKTQTFLVNVDIPANDEYQLASSAFYEQPNDPELSELENSFALMTGEDLTLGAYLLAKEGLKENVDELKTEIIEMEKHKVGDQIDVNKVLCADAVKKYFNDCIKNGISVG